MLRFLTAVVLLVVEMAKLLAVVTATHEVSLTAGMAVIETSVTRPVTVSLSLPTGLLWSTTSPPTVVPPGTPLTRSGL